MTTLRDAAQQALEAMEVWRDSLFDENALPGWRFSVLGEKAITDLRAALSEEAMQRMDPTSQESRQVEPMAWMVYTLDGKSAFITDNPADFTPKHRALPLYTAPLKRKPLTEESLENLFLGNDSNDWWRLELKEFVNVARAIERLHDIGGEE